MRVKSKTVKLWLKNKYIPCPKSTFFRYAHHHYKQGTTSASWKKSPSRLPIIKAKIVVKLTSMLSVGRVTSSIDICNILEKKVMEKDILKTGLSTVMISLTADNTTVVNYKALASVSSKAKIVNTVQQKTNNHHMVENTVMSTI